MEITGTISGHVLLVLRFLLIILLYSFLGWAIWVLWRDLRRSSLEVELPRIHPLTISNLSSEIPKTQQFKAPVISIGRELGCEFIIENKTVSAQHARLSYHHDQWWVEDLESRNGTFLNDDQIAEEVVITSGDHLRIGDDILEILVERTEKGAHK